jgi:nicotinamide phosphoribosyltransferase
MNTRDTLGFAAKGAWFEVLELDPIANTPDQNGVLGFKKVGYDIYKDPVTDDGTKKSLKGLISVEEITATSEETGKTYTKYEVHTQCTPEQEAQGVLQVIYEDGHFHNQTTLAEVRERLNKLV